MRDQDRLRTLHMRVRRHGSLTGGFRLIHEFADELAKPLRDDVDLRAYVQAQIGGNLFVAAAAGVQLVADFAGKLHQPCFDVMMNVFDGRIISRRHAFGRNLIERVQRSFELGVRQHAGLGQRGRVRLAGRHFVGQQDAVERKRPLPLLEFRIRRLLEAARPHLHFFTPDCATADSKPPASSIPALSTPNFGTPDFTNARERAGRPRMRMKPSASFWL